MRYARIIPFARQVLIAQMAWHMGYPLAQTIFTSLYIDRLLDPSPTSLEQTYFDRSESCSDEPITLQILRAYCLGLIKTCAYVNQRVKSEHFHEVSPKPLSRDFSSNIFDRKRISSPILSTEVYLKALIMMLFSTSFRRLQSFFMAHQESAQN